MSVSIPIMKVGQGLSLDLPCYQTAQSAGMDLYAAIEAGALRLEPGARALIPAGIALALPAGYEAQVRPRSGLAMKHGLTVLNAPGTIDADYRGEIGALMINLGDAAFEIPRGMRIAQLVIAQYTQASWSAVSALPSSSRDAGGFGSTGR